MEIVVATRNRKKVEEISRILAGLDVSLSAVDEHEGCPDVEETGGTFRENALIKARAVAGCTGKPALADDSGLEVHALGGAPGVRSARYAGEGADDLKNLRKLLMEMGDMSPDKRGARFVCVMAIVWPDGLEETFEGFVNGTIGTGPRGRMGFGYDPVFYPEGEKRTFAEMRPEEKDGMSHRGRALLKLREYLESLK